MTTKTAVALITLRDHAHAILAVGDRATQIGTHYDGCWVNLRDCFAQLVIDTAETALEHSGVTP